MSQRKRSSKSQDNLTQQTLQDSFTQVADPEEAANNVVRYIIYRAGEHMIFTKSELTRNVIHKAGGKFEEIVDKARTILKNVYGYSLVVCESPKGKDKQYVVSNTLPYLDDPTGNPEEIPEDINKVLLLLILTHLFMSNNTVSEASLYSFLKSVGVDVDLRHPIFGPVKDYINKTLVKQQYLILEVDNITKRHTFHWGVRAENEISQMAILEFVCKMFKSGQPKNWISQYHAAREQATHLDEAVVERLQQ